MIFPSDTELVERTLQGDSQAYSLLVERYRRIVFGLAFHHLNNFEDAHDVSQNVFVRVFQTLAQLQQREKFGSWLHSLVLNECRMWHRSRRENESLEIVADVAARTEPTDTRLAVQQALECLSPDTRLTLTLFYLQSRSMNEIAAFLGVPVSTVKSRLRDARARLKKEMREMIEETLSEKVSRVEQEGKAFVAKGDTNAMFAMMRKVFEDVILKAELLRIGCLQPFTTPARRVMLHAQEEATRLGVCKAEPEHLLLALLNAECFASELLRQSGINADALEESYAHNDGKESSDEAESPMSPRTNKILQRAAEEAKTLTQRTGFRIDIGTEALLLALLVEPNGFAQLASLSGANLEATRGRVVDYLSTTRPKPLA